MAEVTYFVALPFVVADDGIATGEPTECFNPAAGVMRAEALCRSTRSASSNKAEGGDIWFALDETRPLACFAGIWTNWTSVRKVKEGETTNDLFAFLTTEPNAEVGVIHPKAMPVILTTPDEVETWMTAPPDEVLKLQRPLSDGSLKIVARGVKEDPAGQTT